MKMKYTFQVHINSIGTRQLIDKFFNKIKLG